MIESARDNEATLAAIIGPERVLRLRQIALQRRGPKAFRDADTAAALKLTPVQPHLYLLLSSDLSRLIESKLFQQVEGNRTLPGL